MCRHCRCPFGAHGDRAVGGCDGGLSPAKIVGKSAFYSGKYGKGQTAICWCPGFSEVLAGTR